MLWSRAIGDINNDGFDDVAGQDVYSWNYSNTQVHIWLGAENMNQLPTYSRAFPYKELRYIGDLNNDEFADISISSRFYNGYGSDPSVSANFKIIKGASNFNINDDIEILLQGHHSFVSSIRDINNDVKNDIFVDLRDENNNGTTYVFSGDETNYFDVNDSVYDFSDHPFAIFPSVGVEKYPAVIYSNKLYPNYPNPFNAKTKIRYEISQASNVQIRIYNLLGEVVKTLAKTHQSPGDYELNWNGKDDQNRLVAGGIFILELKSEGFVERKKITFLK